MSYFIRKATLEDRSEIEQLEQEKCSVSTARTLPHRFCMQVRYIWVNTIGEYTKPERLPPIAHAQWEAGDQPLSNLMWQSLYAEFQEEIGLPPLNHDDEDRLNLFTEFIIRESIEDAIYAIELTFKYIDSLRPPFEDYFKEACAKSMKLNSDEAIILLNKRFQQHKLSYIFEDGHVVEA